MSPRSVQTHDPTIGSDFDHAREYEVDNPTAFKPRTPSSLERPMRINMHTIFFASTTLAALTGCTSTPSTTPAPAPLASTVLHTEPVVLAEMTCPVTGEVVTCESAVAYFECYPVYCVDRASARQFASLEMKQRARLAAEQVLAQKGIRNTTCPITGDTLTAAGSPAIFEGEVIGFASAADANQFRSLPAEKRTKLIAQWRESESA